MGSVRPKHPPGACPIYNADREKKTPAPTPGPTEPVPPLRNAPTIAHGGMGSVRPKHPHGARPIENADTEKKNRRRET
jgi:hypothetical protein